MPIYIFTNPKTGKTKEIVQGMNDEHKYSEGGVEWERVFLAPQASIDSKIDPFSQNQFVDKIGATKGSIGDVWERSAEMSAKRAEKSGGTDPVKEKLYADYAKKTKGKEHPQKTKERIAASKISI